MPNAVGLHFDESNLKSLLSAVKWFQMRALFKPLNLLCVPIKNSLRVSNETVVMHADDVCSLLLCCDVVGVAVTSFFFQEDETFLVSPVSFSLNDAWIHLKLIFHFISWEKKFSIINFPNEFNPIQRRQHQISFPRARTILTEFLLERISATTCWFLIKIQMNGVNFRTVNRHEEML